MQNYPYTSCTGFRDKGGCCHSKSDSLKLSQDLRVLIAQHARCFRNFPSTCCY